MRLKSRWICDGGRIRPGDKEVKCMAIIMSWNGDMLYKIKSGRRSEYVWDAVFWVSICIGPEGEDPRNSTRYWNSVKNQKVIVREDDSHRPVRGLFSESRVGIRITNDFGVRIGENNWSSFRCDLWMKATPSPSQSGRDWYRRKRGRCYVRNGKVCQKISTKFHKDREYPLDDPRCSFEEEGDLFRIQ